MNDGGPAFPFTPNEQMKLPDGTWDQNTDFGEPGMSLRDWLTGMALAHPYTHVDGCGDRGHADEIATRARRLAEQCLKENCRNEGEPQ